MVRRVVRVGLWAGLAGAAGVGLVQAARWFREVKPPMLAPTWPPLADVPPLPASTEPVDGACPASHPVKGKASSGLFHLPGMVAYERTNADTCFVDADAAEAAGFTRAKR
jgi:hypothetical protein